MFEEGALTVMDASHIGLEGVRRHNVALDTDALLVAAHVILDVPKRGFGCLVALTLMQFRKSSIRLET